MSQIAALLAAEEAAYTKVINNPFPKVNGKPTRYDYQMLRQLCIHQLSENESPFAEAHGTGNAGHIQTDEEFYEMTGQEEDTYPEQEEPALYDETITADTPTFERKKKELNHQELVTFYYTTRGTLRGVAKNLRDALMRSTTNN